tara:strand:- start:399 stop:1535 length:1137 start_codon:yes stop_codon:yes gene_type:complete
MVKLKKKKAGGNKYRYTALIDTPHSMNNVDVGLHSDDKSAIKTLNGILKRKFPKEKRLKEGQKREASNIQKKYDKAHLKFSREVRDVIQMINKYQGDKTDGRIIDKAFSKHLIPFNQVIQSWTDGQYRNPNIDETAKRDYKDEYKKFQSSPKMKKYRAELNKYNRKKGTYGNGDGKDASHKGGKIAGFESQSKNRGRAEKSRLKKEAREMSIKDAYKDLVKDHGAKKALDMLADVLTGGALSAMDDKKVKAFKKKLLKKMMKESVNEDITKLERLAMNLLRDINKNAGVKNYDHKKTADFNKVVKFLKRKMPRVPNMRIGKLATSYHNYRKNQPKIKIPDIDSVKDMEKTLKSLGMKESVNENTNKSTACECGDSCCT